MLMCITVTCVDNDLPGKQLLTFVNTIIDRKTTPKLLSRDF